MPLQSLTLGAASNELRAKNKVPELVEGFDRPKAHSSLLIAKKINIIS
jgi:hypothetical protein